MNAAAMTGSLVLALRHLRHHRTRSLLIVACVTAACAIPLLIRVLTADFQKALITRARATPQLIGPKVNRFDLTMALLYFRQVELPTLSFADFRQLSTNGGGVFIPLNLRFTARHRALVATTPDYFELRGLRPAAGTLPLLLGDAVLGARLARQLKLGVGDSIFSDQRELFDISKPQSLKLHITGVLAPSGGPDDDAVFTDLKSAWILEGLCHAHTAANQVPERLVLNRAPGRLTLSEELIDYNEVTPANISEYHLHTDDAHLPLTGLIFAPNSLKSGTLLRSRLNAGKLWQAVSPMEVVEDLLAYVFRLRSLFDAVSVVLGLLTAAMIGMITALSIRIRSRELETLRRIGVDRLTIAALFSWEIAILIGLGAAAAGLAVGLISLGAPDLVKLL